MIKKLLSNALLSMVMDKSAREKLAKDRGEQPKQKKQAKQETRPEGPNPQGKIAQRPAHAPDAASQAEELARTIEAALEDARQEAANPPKRKPPTAPSRASHSARPSQQKPQTRPMTPEREELIANAVRIHREKVKVLDELDPEAREKLAVMAMMALDPDSLPKAGNAGPVDDIGGARNRPRKRR